VTGAAQSTYDAVLLVLRGYGVARLADNWTLTCMADFSTEQMRELLAAMIRMRPKYPATITEELLSAIQDQINGTEQ